jgi:hypothetical protein
MDSAADTPMGVGFPIRKSSDQRVLPSPRSLSQGATSFIASRCQGIHRMPLPLLENSNPHAQLRREITLICEVTRSSFLRRTPFDEGGRLARNPTIRRHFGHGPTIAQFLFTVSKNMRLRRSLFPASAMPILTLYLHCRALPWWSRTESNRRPPACKAGALPTELRPRSGRWWAWVDSNYRPHAYQACALTT